MAAQIKVAELFAEIGIKYDVKSLNKFQKRLAGLKKQMVSLKQVSKAGFIPKTDSQQLKALNSNLQRTLNLTRQIKANSNINIRAKGGGASGGGGGGAGGMGGGVMPIAAGGGLASRLISGRGFAAVGGGYIAQQIVKAGAEAMSLETALQATLGPAETLLGVQKFLGDEAQRLGFNLQRSGLEYAKLKAAAVAANMPMKDAKAIFTAAQQAAITFGLSTEDTEGVLKAFTQIISKGKVTAEELRNQLGDRLPGAVGLAAKAMGVTSEELSKMLENGEVYADDFIPKMAVAMNEMTDPNIVKAAQNLQAQIGRLETAWWKLRVAMVEGGAGRFFTVVIKGAIGLMKMLTPLIKLVGLAAAALVSPFEAIISLFETLEQLTGVPELLEWTTGALLGLLALLNGKLMVGAIAKTWKLAAPWLALAIAILAVEDAVGSLMGKKGVFSETFELAKVQMGGGVGAFMSDRVYNNRHETIGPTKDGGFGGTPVQINNEITVNGLPIEEVEGVVRTAFGKAADEVATNLGRQE